MNYRSDRDTKLDIILNKICIASRYFEIKQLLGQIDSDDLSSSQLTSTRNSCSQVPSLKIGWQEKVTLHYLVVPIDMPSTSVTFSSLSFTTDNSAISESSPPQLGNCAQVTDFMCRERAHDVFSVSQVFMRLPQFALSLHSNHI